MLHWTYQTVLKSPAEYSLTIINLIFFKDFTTEQDSHL